jgi:hypothetical protein
MIGTETEEKPTSGQSGPPLTLTLDELNADERAIWRVLDSEVYKTIKQIREDGFKNKPTIEKADSRVRNGLRRLIRSRGAEKHAAERGSYRRGEGITANRGEATVTPRAADRSPPPTKERAQAGASPLASGGVTLADIEQRVKELRTQVRTESAPTDEHSQNLAVILAAAELLGPSDTAIAKVTKFSRGYVLRRIKKVKAQLPKKPSPRFWLPVQFWNLVRRAAPPPR